MRTARVVVAAALIALGCSACRDDAAGPSGGTGELSSVESTLNGIESDMNSDGAP